jgi:phage baseplate assembly protein gpV
MGESRRDLGRESRMIGVVGVAALTVLLTAPATAQPTVPGVYSKKIELPARDAHEECVELAAGQRLAYSYSAPIAVQFNIHYHARNKIVYPVRKNARHVRAAYVPHKGQGYCLMWTNPRAKPIVLEYSFDVAAAPQPE